jgi:pyruvate carboxylase subunit B
MMHAETVFKECMADYMMPPEAKAVEPMIPWSPMPGGALTANTQMMRDNNLMDKYEDCIHAMGEVVRRGGFGTSVTPVSQFYFQQAFNNVMFGPWEKIAEGYGKMVLGYFGKTPVSPDPEIVKIASEKLELEPTTENPVDLNDADPNKGVDAAKKLLTDAGIEDQCEENIFIAAACKQKGIDFLLGKSEINGVRKGALTPAPAAAAAGGDGGYTVSVNGKKFAVEVKGDKATVNGKAYDIGVEDGVETSGTATVGHESADSVEVVAPMNAKVVKINVGEGDHVNEGDVIFVVEAMKMEVDVKASAGGTVSSIAVETGAQVTAGQPMASIN